MGLEIGLTPAESQNGSEILNPPFAFFRTYANFSGIKLLNHEKSRHHGTSERIKLALRHQGL
jgi:hypothetical protein